MIQFIVVSIKEGLQTINEKMRELKRELARIAFDEDRISYYFTKDLEEKNDIYNKLQNIQNTLDNDIQQLRKV